MTVSEARRVAVVVPVYHAQFVAECLESIFFQSHQPDEVIVVDDGSPDPTAIDRACAPFGSRVRVLRQVNQGAGAARNLAIRSTDAEFMAFLDADDRWLPDFLREQLAMFERDRDLDVAYTNGMFIGRTRLAGKTLMSAVPSCGDVSLAALLSQRCNVPLSASVARRVAVTRVGLFDASLRRGQDFDLWLRMAYDGARFGYQRQVLMLRRIHEHNLSGGQVTEIERALRVLTKALNTMNLDLDETAAAGRRVRELEAALARERGKELLRRGEFAEAYTALLHARLGRASWKIGAALVGLRLAPQLMRRLYAARADASPAS